jgi:hypothetical protein
MTDTFNNFLPGFFMGITRSIISHPFEILKIKSQLDINKNIKLYSGIHYSILATGIERGFQFSAYDFFRNNDNNLISSIKASSLSTTISLPYNFYLVNKSVINKNVRFTFNNLSKTIPLEFTRSLLGSSIFLYTYNECKDYNFPLWLSAFGGTTASWLTLYPLDSYRNMIISKRIDYKNLYKGIHYPILRSIPSSIIGMYIYEKTKNHLSN